MFLDKTWPEVEEGDIRWVREEFERRERRYGK